MASVVEFGTITLVQLLMYTSSSNIFNKTSVQQQIYIVPHIVLKHDTLHRQMI